MSFCDVFVSKITNTANFLVETDCVFIAPLTFPFFGKVPSHTLRVGREVALIVSDDQRRVRLLSLSSAICVLHVCCIRVLFGALVRLTVSLAPSACGTERQNPNVSEKRVPTACSLRLRTCAPLHKSSITFMLSVSLPWMKFTIFLAAYVRVREGRCWSIGQKLSMLSTQRCLHLQGWRIQVAWRSHPELVSVGWLPLSEEAQCWAVASLQVSRVWPNSSDSSRTPTAFA